MRERVVVAMSGGVDSSVAALLLKEQGYDVIGVKMLLHRSGMPAISKEDDVKYTDDARLICEQLGIPFYAMDYSANFKSEIIDYFVSEYTCGRTPNPCIVCNQKIKFGFLFEAALKLNAKYLATGHYAQILRDDQDKAHLVKGVDLDKDQSYFLFPILNYDLNRFVFPVGSYTKSELRQLAKEKGLTVHDKKDSMEICFIPSGDHVDFIAREYPNKKCKPGKFVDSKGNVLGEHEGIHAYTIGQRKGLGVSTGKRMYVISINPETNEVVLGDVKDMLKTEVKANDFVFCGKDINSDFTAKIRYRFKEVSANIKSYDKESKKIVVSFKEPVSAVTPGQALVLYDQNEVVGGGWIDFNQ